MSAFTKLSEVVMEEVIAGRISARTAKAQLAINADIAFDLDCVGAEYKLRHTKSDWERDRKLNEQAIGCRQARRSY